MHVINYEVNSCVEYVKTWWHLVPSNCTRMQATLVLLRTMEETLSFQSGHKRLLTTILALCLLVVAVPAFVFFFSFVVAGGIAAKFS